MITSLPTLDEIASNPARAGDLSSDVLVKLLARVAAVQSVIAAQLLMTAASNGIAVHLPVEPDEMLTVAEAAKLLRRTPRWIWRHKNLPFVRRISGRNLLCSKRELLKWLAAQTVARRAHHQNGRAMT